MHVSLFDYTLPEELIAQYPCAQRDASRLLVYDRAQHTIAHRNFKDVIDYLERGDLVVFNDTKVILARLFARRKETHGRVEILLLEKIGRRRYRVLLKPAKRLKCDEELLISNDHGLACRLIDPVQKIVEFNRDGLMRDLPNYGHVPLPGYIRRSDEQSDRERYQTVYAKKVGAVAAPTAGLHFTSQLIRQLKKKGVNCAFLSLHVGYGTFAPIRCEDITEHHMHCEHFDIPLQTVNAIRKTKKQGGRVVAVGTTVTRALEANKCFIGASGVSKRLAGKTDVFIYPPYSFSVVDALITNFHLPKSTLYILVSALSGLSELKGIYQNAIAHQYRFFSYGDAMMLI